MDAIGRLRDALIVGKKERGFRKPMYHPDGRLKGYAEHYVEIVAGDLAEACDLAAQLGNADDEHVAAFAKGSRAGKPERHVTVKADQLWHVLDLCKKE